MKKRNKYAFSIQNLHNIWQNSVQNHAKVNLKSMKMCPWTVFGRRSRRGRPQGAQRSEKLFSRVTQKSTFGQKMAPKGHMLDPTGYQTWLRNPIFEGSLAVLASQNRLWERLLKKHEK